MESNYDVTAVFDDGEKEFNMNWDDVYVNSTDAESEIEELLSKYADRHNIRLVKFDY